MSELVLAIASSHAPGLTGWLDKASPESQERVRSGFDTLEKDIVAADPDVIVMICNDHLANARVGAYPDFTIAMAEEHCGPDEWFKDWLKVDDYCVPGNSTFADHIFRGMTSRGHPMYATWENLRYDDNVSVPVTLTGLTDKEVTLVPILQNCTVPPIPDEQQCYEFGRSLREVIDQGPDDLRVGLYATGGMAHEPGGPRYFEIDDEFDRHFLELLEDGSHERVLKEATLERMEEAGSGGTAELLSWIIVLAAAGEGVSCETIFYDPIEQQRCGIGAVHWKIAA